MLPVHSEVPQGASYVCPSLEAALEMLSEPPFSETVEQIYNVGGSQLYKVSLLNNYKKFFFSYLEVPNLKFKFCNHNQLGVCICVQSYTFQNIKLLRLEFCMVRNK